MRVLYVIDSLERGGTEQSLVELIGAVLPLGVSVGVFRLRGGETALARELASFDVTLTTATSARRRPRIAELRRLIRDTNPAIVHTALFESDQAGRLAARRTGAGVVTSLVNTFDDPERRTDPAARRWKLRVASAIDRFTARRFTDHFHAVSHRVARSAVDAYRVPAERVTVIPRGRDPQRLGARTQERRDRVRAALGFEPEDRVVLAVGRQEHQKGHDVLLEGFEALLERHPSARLVVAGRPGSSTAALRERHRDSRAPERIHFLGERDDVPDLLCAADVFVLSSRFEGLPGALIEAMALSLPIVATDIEPVRELVVAERSALLVPVGDASALAQATGRVLEDPALARDLAQRAHEDFLARGTLARSAELMVDLYERVLASFRSA